MPVLPHGVAQRLPPRAVAVENLQFAAAIIIKPLDTPRAGRLAILKNLGWLILCLAVLICRPGYRLPRLDTISEPVEAVG